MAAMASVMSLPAVAPRSSLRGKVAVRGARVVGAKPVLPRPAAVRVHASAARVDLQDDLQLGQVGAISGKKKPSIDRMHFPILRCGFRFFPFSSFPDAGGSLERETWICDGEIKNRWDERTASRAVVQDYSSRC